MAACATGSIGGALITGATGFIGAALAGRLARMGQRTVCIVRAGSRRRRSLVPSSGIAVVETESFDPASLGALLKSYEFDVIFHLASYGVNPADRDAMQLEAGNRGLVEKVLAIAADRRVRRVVFAGSCSEYAPVSEPELLTEDHPLGGTSPYGRAKLAAELDGAARAKQLAVAFVPLRIFGVYGPGEGPERLIPHLLARLGTSEGPALTGGEQGRDLMYVDDVADALVTAATASIAPYIPYNICTGRGVRIRAIAERVAALAGMKGAELGLGRLPYRSDEAMWIVGDPRRFAEATGWKATTELDAGLGATVDALRRGNS